MKNKISMLLIIVMAVTFFSTACQKEPEYVDIPVPDESQVEIDTVTLEQIEERARELEKKYCEPIYVLTYEDIYMLLIAANYEYLSREERSECLNNHKTDVGVCMDYVNRNGYYWAFRFGVNDRGGGSSYRPYPRLAELFFDDDLIAQAEFIDRQLYNYAYQQDEYAMYNIASYVWSEAHPMTTEYAPYHYNGEVMNSGAGYLINGVAARVYNDVIDRYEDMSGYSLAEYVSCDEPDTSIIYTSKD